MAKSQVKFNLKSDKEIIKEIGISKNGFVTKYMMNKFKASLRDYVSYKDGEQMRSIYLNNKNQVVINVPYAEYQAYSKLIQKRVGKRGTRPWERMVNDNKTSILKETAEYSRKMIK